MKNNKRLNKKLALNKETISHLDVFEKAFARGGASILCLTSRCEPDLTVLPTDCEPCYTYGCW